MMHGTWTRRTFLQRTTLATLGVLACPAHPHAHTPRESQDTPRSGSGPALTRALSLRVLQAEATKHQQKHQALPDTLAHLDGLNRLQGFIAAPDGEVIVLGTHEASHPMLSVDDLAIALRSAFKVSPSYQDAPGCSIDPWLGAQDPWRIQRVRVLGMPASAMAARHVAVDYALKQASAGLISLEPEFPSLYAMARSSTTPCAEPRTAEKQTQVTHRFWFYPRYPQPPPRFLTAEGCTLVLKPVGVQVLTEQEFFDHTGQRVGAAPASSEAGNWARRITDLLTADHIPQFASLCSDFRVIEFGKLLHYQQVPSASLQYLLREHWLTVTTVPSFIGGIRRDEREEVVCASQITERPGAKGTRIEAHEQIHRATWSFRGGVEAHVQLTPEHVAEERTGHLAQLRRQVLAARPTAEALWWPMTT